MNQKAAIQKKDRKEESDICR